MWDKDRLLLRRESQQGMYSVTAWFAARTFTTTPVEIVETALFCVSACKASLAAALEACSRQGVAGAAYLPNRCIRLRKLRLAIFCGLGRAGQLTRPDFQAADFRSVFLSTLPTGHHVLHGRLRR